MPPILSIKIEVIFSKRDSVLIRVLCDSDLIKQPLSSQHNNIVPLFRTYKSRIIMPGLLFLVVTPFSPLVFFRNKAAAAKTTLGIFIRTISDIQSYNLSSQFRFLLRRTIRLHQSNNPSVGCRPISSVVPVAPTIRNGSFGKM
jgi:hypothetical protein